VSGGHRIRGGAVITIVVVIGFLVWYFAIRDSDNGGSAPGPSAVAPEAVAPEATTESDLADLSDQLDRPIYWAGDQSGTTTLEFKETKNGSTYVRYLTGNAEPGTPRQAFLTVATYPYRDAMHALEVFAQKPGATTESLPNGGLAVQAKNAPTSVNVAYPDEPDYQIEVYDPDPKKALDLVTSGAVTPVG
jgi:hypothetical protein